MAAKNNRPPPHQEYFTPRPAPTQSSKGVGQRAKQGCARPRNKSCAFYMCKPCCLARPACDKLCIEHRRCGDGTTVSDMYVVCLRRLVSVPDPRRSRFSVPTPASQLSPPLPPCTQPTSQSIGQRVILILLFYMQIIPNGPVLVGADAVAVTLQVVERRLWLASAFLRGSFTIAVSANPPNWARAVGYW
jgi:hypothetical protein